ncbi:MAG: hypothetical protein KA474_07410 [Acinetobacter sp.]|nr:hypothetical protein [Acinetobacter sp.]
MTVEYSFARTNMLGHYALPNTLGMFRAEFQIDSTLIFLDYLQENEHLLDAYLLKMSKRFQQDYAEKSLILQKAKQSLRSSFADIDEVIELYEGYSGLTFDTDLFSLLSLHYRWNTLDMHVDYHCVTYWNSFNNSFNSCSFSDGFLEVVLDKEYNLILKIPEHFYLNFRKMDGKIFTL